MSTGGTWVTFGVVLASVVSACASRPLRSSDPSSRLAGSGQNAGFERASEGELTAVRAGTAPIDTIDAADAAKTAGVESDAQDPPRSLPCPPDMVVVETAALPLRRFCVDAYEASLIETLADGSEQPFPHYLPVDGHDVRAVSEAHTFPQGYISEVQAQDACAASSKRLCTLEEWRSACVGPSHTTFPYGDARRPGACHDTGKSAVLAVFGAKAVAASTPFVASRPRVASRTARVSSAHAKASAAPAGKRVHVTEGRAAQTSKLRATAATGSKQAKPSLARAKPAAQRTPGKRSARPANVDPGVWARLNEPGLGQVEGALSKTGEHNACVNDFGVYDMVGNLHEWVATDAAAAHGTFAGGYYLDTTLNGDGCNYKTVAHAHDYHDYSTGFRCCAEAAPKRP